MQLTARHKRRVGGEERCIFTTNRPSGRGTRRDRRRKRGGRAKMQQIAVASAVDCSHKRGIQKGGLPVPHSAAAASALAPLSLPEMEKSLESQARFLPSSSQLPLRRVSTDIQRGPGRPVPPNMCEQHEMRERHLNSPGAPSVCPTYESEGTRDAPEWIYVQLAEGASPGPATWVRRPAAALSSTYAMAPWGKAEGAITGSKGSFTPATLEHAHMENLEAIYRGQRLADIYPSFFESTSDTTGDDQSEPLVLRGGEGKKKKGSHFKRHNFLGKKRGKNASKNASQGNLSATRNEEGDATTNTPTLEGASSESLTGGQGGKKKRGPFKIKIPVSGKRKGKRGSQGGSREALLTPHGDESDADAENSTTEASSSGSLAGGQGGKKKRGPFKIKIPVPGKRKGKRGSHGGSREALLTPHGDESDADAENSTTEGSSSEPLAEGEDRKKKKGLRRLKSAFAGKKRRNGSPPSSSQENLVAPGGDEGEAEAETPRPDATEEIKTESNKKKRSILRSLRSKKLPKKGSAKRATSLGVVFDANRLAQTTDIGKEVLGSFTTNANQQKEIFEAIEATTADGDSCLKFVVDLDTERVGYFPHELQSVRQGLLIYTACERILEDLKQFNGSQPNALLDGISSSPTPGNSVKVLDDFLQPSEPVFTVQTVEGQTASLEGVEKTVNVLKLILAPNAVEVAFVDTALNGSWHTLENEDPEIFARLLDFATQSGYGETLETGRKTGNFGGLLLSLKEKSSVFRIVAGVRHMLGAPVPEYPSGRKAGKKWKDASTKYSILSAAEAMKMIEMLQIVLIQHALPGCLPLNAASLMMQPSLLLAHLLESLTAGSTFLGPVGLDVTENTVNRAYLSPTASPIQEIGRHAPLRSQCLAGIFFELGLNAAGVESLSCHSHWKSEQRVKGRHAYSPAAHTFSHLMSSVCSTGDAKKSQAGLLPRGSLSSCNSDCLVKAALRKGWANKETEKHRKKYRLRRHHIQIGDALRMATFYSFDEVVELDQIVAGAWLVAKQLLVSSRDLTKSVSVGIPPSVENQAGPSSHSEPKQQQAESGMSGPSPGSAHALSSSEAEGASLLEDSRKLSPPTAHHPVTAEEVHPFVVGGNANINAMNISATANVCRLLLETDMTHPLLFASTVLTNIRGYINDSGAGLESTEKQRKLAKRSDVFATIYKCFSCGLGGELLPPLFAPFASIALQIGTFLRVELEESKALPWEKIVQTMGDGVFSTKAHESAVKHLKKKAASFLEMFTPCVAEVEEASELLMPSESAKNKRSLLRSLKKAVKRTKGKRRGATGEMCRTSGELQQLVRLLLVWWVLGPSSSEPTQEMTESFQSTATTFRNARLAFTFLIFNNGHNQAKVAMELVKAGCKTNKFVVPPGWALGSKKGRHGARELSFKDISKDIMASFMYTESALGSHGVADWILPLKAAQQLVDICAQHPVVQLGELLSTDAGNVILMGHQCIKLQDEGIKLISKVLGKRSKTVDEGYSHVLVQFLRGVNAWNDSKGSAGLSQAFGRYASTSEEAEQQAVLAEWNGDFPSVDCPWKRNKRAQTSMIRRGTSYQEPAHLPGKAAAKAMEFHCPAHAPLRMQNLAEVPLPDSTQFCTEELNELYKTIK